MMSDLRLTQHALARMAQRGIQPSDIPFILAVGSEVPDGLMVLKSDVLAHLIHRRCREGLAGVV